LLAKLCPSLHKVKFQPKLNLSQRPSHRSQRLKASKKLTVDSTDMSYSVDSTASAFTIKITNKSTGEVIRKLDFKAFSPEVHLTSKLTGTLVDVTS
jgi:hypothetical protein